MDWVAAVEVGEVGSRRLVDKEEEGEEEAVIWIL